MSRYVCFGSECTLQLTHAQIKVDKIEYSKENSKQAESDAQPTQTQVSTQEPPEEPETQHEQELESADLQSPTQDLTYEAPPVVAETENLWNE